jgi:hypothetical protein
MPDAGRAQTMQLVAQDFAEVLDTLKKAAEAKGHERRTTARMDVQAQIKVHPYKDGQVGHAYTCLTRDLSFKGIGLFQSTQAARGSQVVVLLPREDAEALAVLCTVMYCRTMADGLYNVGVSFNRVFDIDAKPAVEFRGGAAGAAGSPPTAGAGAGSGEDELKRIRRSILD